MSRGVDAHPTGTEVEESQKIIRIAKLPIIGRKDEIISLPVPTNLPDEMTGFKETRCTSVSHFLWLERHGLTDAGLKLSGIR